MDSHSVRDYLEQVSVNELVIRIALLRHFLQDLDNFTSLESLERSLDRTLSAHYTVYFERSFRPEQLQDIPRYLVYRLHAFGTPITSVANSNSTSGDSSPLPSATEE